MLCARAVFFLVLLALCVLFVCMQRRRPKANQIQRSYIPYEPVLGTPQTTAEDTFIFVSK